jgi:hypothetical protein
MGGHTVYEFIRVLAGESASQGGEQTLPYQSDSTSIESDENPK